MSLHLGLLLAYSVGLIGLGLWISRKVETSGAFFVADRRLSAALLFATFLAMNIGAASTIGAAGLGYRDGVSAWWWGGSAGVGTLALAFWIGPRIWRRASENGLYTVGDYLELRYGRSVRATIAALLWVASLFILAGQFIAMAEILEVVAGAPRWTAAVLSGVVVTAYFAAGGLVTSAWLNVVQLGVLLLGFAITVPWALSAAGGWGAVVAALPPQGEHLSFFQGGGSGFVYLALVAPAFIVSPGLIQKVYGAIDERAIRIGLGATGVAMMLFAVAPPLMGMIAHVYAPELVNREHALQTVLVFGVPALLGGLGLAAVFSAEISSADAILFMLSTSLSKDLYKRFLRPEATDGQVLRVARGAALAGGVIAVALAVTLESVIATLTIFYALLGATLFVPIVAGLHSKRPAVPEALAAIVAGASALFILFDWRSGPPIARFWTAADAPWYLAPSLLGLASSALAFAGVFAIARALRARRAT